MTETETSREATSPEDAEPPEAIPVGSSRKNLLTIIAAWATLVLVIVAAGWFVWDQLIRPDGGDLVSRYADGDEGVTYESIEDQFGVIFPSRWRRHVTPSALGDVTRVESTPGPDYLFSVTRAPIPETALENFKQSLRESAADFAKAHNAKIVVETPSMPFIDMGVKDVVMEKGGSTWRVRFVLATDRIYTLEARTPNDDDGPFKRLVESFVPLGPR